MNPSNGTVGNFNVPSAGGPSVSESEQGLPRPEPASLAPSSVQQPLVGQATDETLLDQAIAHAENIIIQTRLDPQQQSVALEKLKVDYIRSRFGRAIRIADN